MLRMLCRPEPVRTVRELVAEMHSPGGRPRLLRVSTSRRVSFTDEAQKRWSWGHLTQASLLNVFGHLDSRDVAVACCVCQHWQEVGRAQSLWRELLEREFRWASPPPPPPPARGPATPGRHLASNSSPRRRCQRECRRKPARRRPKTRC